MRIFLFRFLVFSGLALASYSVTAQLTAPNRVSARASAYSSGDSLFFFSDMAGAHLRAVSTPGSQFRWLKYNDATGAFDQEQALASGSESVFSPAAEGGYRVSIQLLDGTINNFNCWCFASLIDSVSISPSESNCYLLTLESNVVADSIIYYNPNTNDEIKEVQKYSYEWSSNPEIVLNDSAKPLLRDLDAPVENLAFTLKVTNESGNRSEATLNHQALAVLAEFSFEVTDREWDHELGDEKELSAPATLRYGNQSKGNITAYEWVFKWSLETDSSTSRVYEAEPVYTFQNPGSYDVSLTVYNERSGCSSESSAESITVLESFIDFPNVFSPNGDGVNDEFRPAFQSVKKYNIVIYSRWGRNVYESSDLSVGWDGKVGNGDAAEGVYFYVCEAEGYIKGEHHRKKGSVTLLR